MDKPHILESIVSPMKYYYYREIEKGKNKGKYMKVTTVETLDPNVFKVINAEIVDEIDSKESTLYKKDDSAG